MSKLIDKLVKQRQPDVRPMGFLPGQSRTDKIKLLLGAVISAENLEKLAAGLKSADAVLVEIAKADDLSILEKAAQNKESPTVGGWIKSNTAAVTKKVATQEFDFMVLAGAAPVTLIRKEKTARLLEIDINLSEGLLRATGELPVEAVLVSGKASELALNINRLVQIQRLLIVVNKPLLLAISDNLSQSELQVLWDAGVGGVIIEVNDANDLQSLNDLRDAIDQLEAPAFRKKARAMAILPRAQGESVAASPDHEEEEEDE
jgi:hypothetical protein